MFASCVCVCYLLAQGHATPQSAGEPDDFGHKGFEREVFFQDHSSQDGLHLRDTGPWRENREMRERRERETV